MLIIAFKAYFGSFSEHFFLIFGHGYCVLFGML